MQFGNPIAQGGSNANLIASGPIVVPISTVVTIPVSLPASTRTIIVKFNTEIWNGVTGIEIQGASTSLVYWGNGSSTQMPYLGGSGGGIYPAICVAEVSGAVDPVINIILYGSTVGAPTLTYQVFADTIGYPESTFYVGDSNSVSTSTATNVTLTLAAGPFRIISVWLLSLAGASGVIQKKNFAAGGTTAMINTYVPNIANTPAQVENIEYTPALIVPYGGLLSLVNVNNGFITTGGAELAYP